MTQPHRIIEWLKTEWFIRTQRLFRYEKWYEDSGQKEGITQYICYTLKLGPLKRIKIWINRGLFH